MKISRYNAKITVQRLNIISDEIGRQIESWSDYFNYNNNKNALQRYYTNAGRFCLKILLFCDILFKKSQ